MNCQHFGTCGGCSLPGVPYAEQLARKQAWLSRLLSITVPPLLPSPSESRFRSKVAFVFGATPRGLVMGHFAAGSQRVVPVEECPVHSDRGNRLAFALRDRLARARVTAAGPSLSGILRHVIIRTTEDERQAVVMLVVTHNDKSLRKPVRAFLDGPEPPDGFFINIHNKPGPFMVGRETIKIHGRSHVKEGMYLVSPTAFFQTNVGAARELVKLVIDGVGTADRVLDLYSGSGLFALPLALRGSAVTAVEENRQAIQDLEANLRINRIPDGRVRGVCARVEEALPRLKKEAWQAVVLDPPREGLSPAVIAGVFEEMAPPRAVLVSCNPDALATELPQITAAGYRVVQVQPVDMFPHTEHIETVVVLQKS